MNAAHNTANSDKYELSAIFADIRKASDTNDQVTASLIMGLFNYEVAFAADVLKNYFLTAAANRKELQTKILSQNDEEFAKEIRFLNSEAEKDKKDRDASEIEVIMRRHKSLRNIFHSCMQAAYFLRVGGTLEGTEIGPVKTLKLVAKKFTITYFDEDGDAIKLQGKYSSAALIRAGAKAIETFKPSSTSNAGTRTPPVNAKPVAMVNAAANTINTLLDAAIKQTAEEHGNKDAQIDDMPDDVVNTFDTMLARLLKAKFAHAGKIELIDVASWITDTVKDITLDISKQVRPLKKTA